MKPTNESIISTAVKAIDNALGDSIQELVQRLKDRDLIDDEIGDALEFDIQCAIDKRVHQFHETPVE